VLLRSPEKLEKKAVHFTSSIFFSHQGHPEKILRQIFMGTESSEHVAEFSQGKYEAISLF